MRISSKRDDFMTCVRAGVDERVGLDGIKKSRRRGYVGEMVGVDVIKKRTALQGCRKCLVRRRGTLCAPVSQSCTGGTNGCRFFCQGGLVVHHNPLQHMNRISSLAAEASAAECYLLRGFAPGVLSRHSKVGVRRRHANH